MAEREDIRPDSDDYRQILLSGTPLIDMRAPLEFQHGSFPSAINLPLMDDEERAHIGTTYKHSGQDAAIEAGHDLVKGATKTARVAAWVKFATENPAGYLFCMRGGLRSRISQGWMADAGVHYPRVSGGYKALRRFLIEETERLVKSEDFIIVAGRTGVGKTQLLANLPEMIDLEGLANHRGSSFGRRIGDQPTQINFENSLGVELMRQAEKSAGPIFVEDESRRIGQLAVPDVLAGEMANWPAVIIEEPIEERINAIHLDYVRDMLPAYNKAFSGDGFEPFSDFLLSALSRIKKRLGGVRYSAINTHMKDALSFHKNTGDDNHHRVWITALLQDYYDPMYDYQLSKSTREILFRGSRNDCLLWQQERATHQ